MVKGKPINKFKRLFLQVSSNKKEISIPPKTKYGKTGKKGSKFYTKKIICTHETVLKNTKIDKICYAVLVQIVSRTHNFTNGEPK